MKCPECGSENVICFLNSSENFPYCKCNGCKKVFDYTDKMEQQDRLDKVLSKLKQSEQFCDEHYYNYLDLHDNPITEQLIKYICYDEEAKTFIDGISVVKNNKMLFDYERNTTLEFVESLLKDMVITNDS